LVRLLDSAEGVANRLAVDRRTNGITLASALPGQRFREWGIEVDGRDEKGGAMTAHVAWVDSNYFEVLGIPLFEGRAFEEGDLSGDGSYAPVAVVNRSFAEEYFGNESPLGERVRFVGAISAFPGDPRTHPWAEVIGVVDDVGVEVSDPGRP